MSFPRLSAGWMTCALLGTEAANAGRLFERARRLLRPTAESRLGSFGNPGNGRYREELRKVLSAIGQYLVAHQLSQPHTLLRLDGQYGTGAVLTDVAGFAFVTRGKEYSVLDHPLVQARLHLPPDQFQQREDKKDSSAASTIAHRSRWDPMACAAVWWWPPIPPRKRRVRLASRVEVSSTNSSSPRLSQQAFTAADVVELYLHRGAYAPALFDEDQEIEPDRWCSHSAS
jgi:hypothetical protein